MKADERDEKIRKGGLLNLLAGNENCRKIILGAGLIGIALIFLSSFLTNSGKTEQKTDPSGTASTAQDYETHLEKELTDLIMKIQGVGNASVMVTLEQTKQSVYAKEEKNSGQTTKDQSDGSTRNETDQSNETNYILVKGADGSEQALAVTEIQPVVKGVVVVCDGGGNAAVQQSVIDAVTTALDISSVRVCVIKAK
ncbi:stage III sporulation protein AG [Caproiciproducens sp. NJN-50]|uniref:stage III sporulation protein AG n=1 Tax=Acutalibacteraceae TaxID=3082771 RepID=UPI000FFE18A1|nr:MULTISPECIES: stage III sporulation protein AG [Acutalibacteraceae]QAT49667.1 stage III sporulation protein AG [Caproiciproducens sp. NJN-50]